MERKCMMDVLDHLCKVDTMLVGLRNRDLAEYSQVTTI